MTLTESISRISDGSRPHLPGFKGLHAWQGPWRGLWFIATEDHDQQVEISLSRVDRARVTSGQAKAFFRHLGHKPVFGPINRTLTSHFLMRRGAAQ